jgi:60 kDa SS-A/Ro ribonucleoprotein
MMKTNVKTQSKLRTHEGAPSPSVSATKELRRAVMSCMLFEKQFYESGEDSSKRIASLVAQVSFEDAAQCAIDAREKFKLRHVPLFIVRELLRRPQGRKMGDLIHRIIQRPDELGELLSLYWKDQPNAPLATQLKIGLARAIKKFNEYSLAKHDGEGISVRDVLFLVHARPKFNTNGEAPPAWKIDAIDKPGYKRGQVLRHAPSLFDRIANQTMVIPDTWETQLSAGADKKETFTRLLTENKLGGMALLRNLRNMTQAGVSTDLIKRGIETMKTDRILPFRFLSAAKYGPQFEPFLESAMFRCLGEQPRLEGRTALLVDHSMSMNSPVSAKSEITRFDAAAALAMMLREISSRCRVFTFSTVCDEIAPRRGFAINAALNAVRQPHHTLLGAAVKHVYSVFPECTRIIVVTDEQSADRPPHPQGAGYVINVAGAKNGIAYGPWVSIDGWSEAIIDYIQEYEQEAA